MLGTIEKLMGSEYNNAGELLGAEDLSNELLGYLGKLNPVKRAQVISKIAKKPTPSKGSRAEFEKFMGELPTHIKDGLMQGKLRLADHIIYSIKPVNGSKTVKMFESQDVKEVGLRNISSGKLPKNMVMMLSGIYLLQGIAATTGSDDVKSTTYDSIDGKAALATGEFTLRANKKQILSETANIVFKTAGFDLVPKGYYKLHNPRLIMDDVDVEFDIDLGTITGLDAKAYLFVGLHGTVTIP
jgi:hypothetical protein